VPPVQALYCASGMSGCSLAYSRPHEGLASGFISFAVERTAWVGLKWVLLSPGITPGWLGSG
jgi:hypothetical protein